MSTGFSKKWFPLVLGGGGMVSVLTFHSGDQSSNPAASAVFILYDFLKRQNINEKEAEEGPFLIKNRLFYKSAITL